jgi:hypothetical protein
LRGGLTRSLAELKVLPTQPETPTIPEEEEDDEERERAEDQEGEGVEASGHLFDLGDRG